MSNYNVIYTSHWNLSILFFFFVFFLLLVSIPFWTRPPFEKLDKRTSFKYLLERSTSFSGLVAACVEGLVAERQELVLSLSGFGWSGAPIRM
jgi:hypothetical protein